MRTLLLLATLSSAVWDAGEKPPAPQGKIIEMPGPVICHAVGWLFVAVFPLATGGLAAYDCVQIAR